MDGGTPSASSSAIRTITCARAADSSPLLDAIEFRVHLYAVAVGLSVLGSCGGLVAATSFLLLGDSIRVKALPWAISYAVGTLLGVSLLALLPQALDGLPPTRAL